MRMGRDGDAGLGAVELMPKGFVDLKHHLSNFIFSSAAGRICWSRDVRRCSEYSTSVVPADSSMFSLISHLIYSPEQAATNVL